MTRRFQAFILLLIILLLSAACAPSMAEPAAAERPFELPATPVIEAEPAYIQLVATADVVFLGQVSFISETKQHASGDTYHQIALSVLETGIDAPGIGSGVVLLAPGESPLNGRYPLAIGDEVVVMARQSSPIDGGAALIIIPTNGDLFISPDQWDDVMATVMRADLAQ